MHVGAWKISARLLLDCFRLIGDVGWYRRAMIF